MKELNIGDSLFKRLFVCGIGEYKIYGIRRYVDSIQYETECLSCNHGRRKCKVLIAQDKNGFRYVTTIDDDEDEPQYPWHDDGPYYTTKNEAHAKYLAQIIYEKKQNLEKKKKECVQMEKEIKEQEITLKGLKGE